MENQLIDQHKLGTLALGWGAVIIDRKGDENIYVLTIKAVHLQYLDTNCRFSQKNPACYRVRLEQPVWLDLFRISRTYAFHNRNK